MEWKDLIKDEIYVFKWNTGCTYIWKYDTSLALDQNVSAYYPYFSTPLATSFRNGRLATPQEKAHLQACITAGTYVDALEEFTLPKYWYIKYTDENRGVLNKWKATTKYSDITTNWLYLTERGGELSWVRREERGITFDQFKQYVLKEPVVDTTLNKPKFEVGKWYRNLGGREDIYSKFEKISEGYFCGNDYIYNGKFTTTILGPHNKITGSYKNAILLTDLSEIQQYLPDEHVDKIKPTQNLNELLEEAKRRYPIGTKFKYIDDDSSTWDRFGELKVYNDKGIAAFGEAWVYYKGKWAEIVSLPETKPEYITGVDPATPKYSFHDGLKTELDILLEETKAKNLSLESLIHLIRYNIKNLLYNQLDGQCSDDKAQILYDKWNGVAKHCFEKPMSKLIGGNKWKWLEDLNNSIETKNIFVLAETPIVYKTKYFNEEPVVTLESLINNL